MRLNPFIAESIRLLGEMLELKHGEMKDFVKVY